MFKVGNISNQIDIGGETWIYISALDSFKEPDSFVKLVKLYQSRLCGKIVAVSGNMQYTIDNDPLNLIFQWDDCFGITVVVPNEIDISVAEKTLSNICDELNEQEKS